MVVKSQIKFIKSLQLKKYRDLHGMFTAEGTKTVREFLNSRFSTEGLYATNPELLDIQEAPVTLITESELKKLSYLKTPNKVIGIFHIPEQRQPVFDHWTLALDGIRDPGNLGTIIRLCDWFGIDQVICSPDCVDCYNPKVVQASMGSLARVHVIYTELNSVLTSSGLPLYGAFMTGSNVTKVHLPQAGVLVMGSEGSGISEAISRILHERISIPRYGEEVTESLNVATATAILLHELRRN